jgi:diguanylate cyclase (GGDEF)-like protein/PAS domain S-box-containing protein
MNKQVIICVDDEISILKSLKSELKNALGSDYQIELAEGGEEALELIEVLQEEGYEIPLIISDYFMPVMKGDELLRLVHLTSPNTIKIMLTGQANIEAISNVIKYANLYRYIAKPWESEDLKLTVIEAINRYIQERMIAEKNTKLQELNQKQAELILQLHQNENRLKKFLDAMPVGVFVVDLNGDPFYINYRAQELLCHEIITNINAENVSRIYHEWSQDFYPLVNDILQKALLGETATTDDLEIRQKNDDRVIPIEMWGTPIYNELGEISYAIAAFQDITQHKQAEKLLEDYSKTLEMQVQERTAALEQVNLELKRLATLDGLTQVANRRRFDECLSQEWRRMALINYPLSLILCDVDYFKCYNDHYGHQQGDYCLQQVANAIRRAVKKPADLVARYGGEEFAVILPNTPEEGARAVATSIRQEITRLNIPHANSDVSSFITISLGISTVFPSYQLSPEILIAEADKALYEAKKQGRDRMIMKIISAEQI